ncbi:MAG: hypothetical protein E6356_00050 [Terrisporobacter othiniensis]|uniref:Uncharacterized protein n=2 Tax=Terrisporobacter TaxID=1505652 RepID=A0AAX2ZH23_9FIRM|nr:MULTISPECIES: hypothetical protein [Terrisporobacter]MBN9647469.1 hypothetical protein [Terrisporobacter glycolicus]MDU4862096.1 hypothetical protein [Terrisporobacter othiniensis]MDU6993203.1 hypothetical protein [Terrisporobacter othiniensis]UEL48366.1 hypothetical protein JW646_02620 [Terrisporobacter hibernicus]SFJ32625.1 hypothetical protein SAMN02910355_2211 [Terrisporobacter glycolicus]
MAKVTKPVTDVGKEVINGVGNVAKETVNTGVNVGKDVINGVGNVAKETINTGVNVGKAVKDNVKGAKNNIKK